MSINGKHLINMGFEPGPHFPVMLAKANELIRDGATEDEIVKAITGLAPEPIIKVNTRPVPLDYHSFLTTYNGTEIELKNIVMCYDAMARVGQLPTVKAMALMPDACPAGTLPVGGIAATENAIHPDMHSADICCSMCLTVLDGEDDLKHVLDTAQAVTHFGPCAKERIPQRLPSSGLMARISENKFLESHVLAAYKDFMSQGDGNHFLFVGRIESTGQTAIVTHHGSRSLGARLYSAGMKAAKRHTHKHASGINDLESWIEAESVEGEEYWNALQIVRLWTMENHLAIHNEIGHRLGRHVLDRHFNEHNFVFRKTDGLFYHAKGATPSFDFYSPTDTGYTIIPMNMAEPVLITTHRNRKEALGFAPHGAGRNMTRTFYRNNFEAVMPEGIDVRAYIGDTDVTELPGAYKSSRYVTDIIEKDRLANIVERVIPYGSIMAGDLSMHQPWRKKKGQSVKDW